SATSEIGRFFSSALKMPAEMPPATMSYLPCASSAITFAVVSMSSQSSLMPYSLKYPFLIAINSAEFDVERAIPILMLVSAAACPPRTAVHAANRIHGKIFMALLPPVAPFTGRPLVSVLPHSVPPRRGRGQQCRASSQAHAPPLAHRDCPPPPS